MAKNNHPRLSDLTDEDEQLKKIPKVWPVDKETIALANGLHFSDLTEEQLNALFCNTPLFRFDISSVQVKCKRFTKQPKLYGLVHAAEFTSNASQYVVFRRDTNDPVVIRGCFLFLDDISCSIPASSSNYIQISAKLYLTTHKEDKVAIDKAEKDKVTTDNTEKDKVTTETECVVNENDHFCDNEIVKLMNYFTFTVYGSMTLKSKDVVENDDQYDMEVYQDLERRNLNIPSDNMKKKIDLNDNEPFELCDGNMVINLSDACFGSNVLRGKGGSLQLNYVALKYAVDAALELEFVVPSKEMELTGTITAYYGNNFDYGSRHDKKEDYKAKLLHIRPVGFVKSGKINLIRSVLAVPAQFSLIIDAHLRDPTGEYILKGFYEFFVPRKGGSSYGSIVGNDLSLKLKVDWKLPHDMLSL